MASATFRWTMRGRNAGLMRFGCGLCSLLSVAFLPALALGAPRVPTHVACVGDSITAGTGASVNGNYPL